MFFRPLFYSLSQPRSFDANSAAKDAMLGDAYLAQDILGQTLSVVSGLSATSTSTLAITMGAGRLYIQAITDATAVADGDLAADATVIEQQAWFPAQSLVLTTAALTPGQSQWVLIEVGFSQADSIAPSDPGNGLENFFNSANWTIPLVGPGGNNMTIPTLRTNGVVPTMVYGSPAATGSQTPPNSTSGNVGLYLVLLTYGQTVVTQIEILVAGPSVGANVPSNYPYAPFLAGLLSSHHDGNPGQAPKINLATETQGTLPNSGFNQQVFASSGTFTVPVNVASVYVEVWGGGGGGGGSSTSAGGGGGGGGYVGGVIAGLTPGTGITVTIGAGGTAGTSSGAGGTGGTTSFGSYATATGGVGGGANDSSAGTGGGASGGGTGAFLVGGLAGGFGGLLAGSAWQGGLGGSTFEVSSPLPSEGTAGASGTFPGGGANGGGYTGSAATAGGSGAAGLVIVRW